MGNSLSSEFKYPIIRPKYTIIRPISNPGVNKLFLIEDKDGTKFVLKLIPESCNNDIVMREYENLRNFNSEHILKAYDCSVISADTTLFKLPQSCLHFVGGIAIVLEYCEGGDLTSLGEDISEETKMEFTRQIISAIALIHSRNMLHRDIKPHNIFLKMVNGRQIAVVGDFGESKMTASADKTQTHTKTGTTQYEAPEVINGMRYSARADAYSLGLTIIEIFSPNSFHLRQWLDQVNRNNRNDLDVPAAVPVAVRKCVWAMTTFSTEDRLTVAEISEFISKTRELENFHIFLKEIWRIRLKLIDVRDRMQESLENAIKTITKQTKQLDDSNTSSSVTRGILHIWSEFKRVVHILEKAEFAETTAKMILGAQIELRYLQISINLDEFGSPLLLDKATQIKARLDKYCSILQKCPSHLIQSEPGDICEFKGLKGLLNDKNRLDEHERSYYNMNGLNEKINELCRLLENNS